MAYKLTSATVTAHIWDPNQARILEAVTTEGARS